MAKTTRSYFEATKEVVDKTLDEITFQRFDISPDRAIFEFHSRIGQYGIRIKEIYSKKWRTYSFYVLSEGKIVVGFDNYPERRALRKKYGRKFKKHLFERIPHKHGLQKSTMELTDEMCIRQFLDFLQNELS